MRRKSHRAALAGIFSFIVITSALAWPALAEPASSVPFARYVPASAKLYIAVRQLREVDTALNRAHVWRFLPLLAGSPADTGTTFDLPKGIATMLGLPGSTAPEDVLGSEMGLVATSWLQLGSAVWFLRASEPSVVDRWFPPSGRTAVGTVGEARFFQTAGGAIVCIRDGIVAVARRWGPGSLLNQTLNLMAGHGGERLEHSPVFRELRAYLPDDPLAMAYMVKDHPPSTDEVKSSLFWPDIDRAVVGLYEGRGRIDVAIRASLAQAHRKPTLSPRAIDGFFKLPHTTLFAWATTIDLDRAYEAAARNPSSGPLARYLSFLSAFQEDAPRPGQQRDRLGPNVVIAAGQDLREGRAAPQVAIMVECTGDRAIRHRARRVAERIIRLVRLLDPAKVAEPLTIRESRHLGVMIQHVPLRAYAEHSQLPPVRLLRNADPAWIVWNGWLIVALDRHHIEHILDAQFGLFPTLANVRDVQPLRESAASRSVLSVIQADLISDMLEQWVAAYQAGAPSFLDPAWWQDRALAAPPDRSPFGIELKETQEPGVVVVAHVDRDSAAAGRLRVADRILGVDGHLLALTSADIDWLRRLRESTAAHGPTVRLQRGGTAMDVVLLRSTEDALLTNLRTKPAEAVKELASLGRTLQFVSFAVNASDEMRYSARLSLRLTAQGTATVSTASELGKRLEE